jgi:hypothetical protein
VALVLALSTPAVAQTPRTTSGTSRPSVTTSDIQRLQDQVYDTGNEISRLRSRDQVTADRLDAKLDDLRDDVIYLKVKLRKEGSVPRNEYDSTRSQIDSVRSDARGAVAPQASTTTWPSSSDTGSGTSPWGSGGTEQSASRRNEVPAGTELDVRLDRELSSDTAQVEDRVIATTLADLYQGNTVLIPAGSSVRGIVTSVTNATRTERKGSLTLRFDQFTINGRTYPTSATVTQALESEGIKGEVAKIGAGAGVGAVIGGIIGGTKGALLGILIGGGGTIAATEGKDVTLPPGTVLRVRLEQALLVK